MAIGTLIDSFTSGAAKILVATIDLISGGLMEQLNDFEPVLSRPGDQVEEAHKY